MKILVVDDDREIVELLTIYLKNENYEIVKAYDGKQALEKLKMYPDIDMIILDIMMPRLDGISVVHEVRKENAQLPILLLSAKSTDIDKIQGLTNGADDYVTKPFNPLEVIARVKSLLRRSTITQEGPANEEITIGPLTIKKESHQVTTTDGTEIQLTVLEFEFYTYLQAIQTAYLVQMKSSKRYGNKKVSFQQKTVMVHVSHLRDKIAEATGGEKVIETVWGVGYKIEDK